MSGDQIAASGPAGDGPGKAIIEFIASGLEKGCYDAVFIPHRVPANDSYVYLLIKDPEELATSTPLAPIMPTQGGKALASITRFGTDGMKIAAVMRPCEARAAIELSKLFQCKLEDVFLITYDCPGVLPLKVYNDDPDQGESVFRDALKDWNDSAMRPLCQVDTQSCSAFGDIHVGIVGNATEIRIISNSPKGEELIGTLGLEPGADPCQRRTRQGETGTNEYPGHLQCLCKVSQLYEGLPRGLLSAVLFRMR